jgi:hypothetical protein
LYLWHYPIFSFSEITNILNFESRFNKLFLIFVVFIFSIFSYFFIEKPFRNKFIVSTKVLTIVLSFLFFFIIIFNLYVVKNEGLLNRLSEVQINFFKNNNFRNLKSLDGQLCFKTAKSFCEYNINKPNTVFLLGDSHAAQIADELKNSLNNRNFNFVVMANKCLRIPFFDYVRINDADETFCEKDYHKLVHDRLLYSSNSIIIITGRWTQYLNKGLGFSNNEGQKEIDNNNFVEFRSKDFDFKLFLDLISKNNKIILIYPIPEVGFNVKQKIFKDFTFLFKKNNNTQISIYSTNYKVFEARNKISFSLLDSFENSNVLRVYPHKIFCNTLVNNRCIVNDKFNIFYDDDNHLSPMGSQLLTEEIIKVVDSLK